MKIKILLAFIVFPSFFCNSINAQSIFGFKAGMQLTKMTGFEDVPKSLLPTIQVKGVAIMPLGDELTINPSLGYSGKGFKWNDLELTDPVGNSLCTGDII